MSVETMSLVLNHSKASGTAKVVLIGIANHDGDGGSWPSIATLARYANTSERSVQRAIEQLVESGELVVHANAGGTFKTRPGYRPNRYVITVKPNQAGVTPVSPLTNQAGVTRMTGRGDASVAGGVTPVSPEPSLNHPEPAAAARGESGRNDPQPGDNFPGQIRALATAFADVPTLDSISFTMRAVDQATVCALVDRHGVPRLVRAAAETKTGNVRRAAAFIETWSGLRKPRQLAPLGDEDRCPVCSRSITACAIANSKLDPENRCEGPQTMTNEITRVSN